jgi:hypothetical protein
MSYLLDKTNNASVKISVPDGTLDNTSTSLSLIGRAFVGWGEAINENFLALLENFADSTPPRNALVGQLWYDSTVAKLKYFDGSSFNTLAVYPPLSEGFLYNNSSNAVQWLSASSLSSAISAAIFPNNSTGGLNAYLQRTSTGALTWVVGTSVLTDALPSGDGFLTKNANGSYSLTSASSIATKADLTALSGSTYTLPTASTSVLGGVKIDGTTITISSGVISAVSSSSYSLPTASTSVLGGVKVDGTTITISSGVISAVSSGGTSLPGNATGYLYNNGSGALSWGTPSSGSGGTTLPAQTGNSGKFLTTDGTSLSWGTPAGGSSSTGGFAQFGLWYKSTAGTETFTVPAGITLLRVAASSAYYDNSNNASSAIVYGWVTVTPGQTISVTVGDGVFGASGLPGSPNSNGLTSFGTYLTASLTPLGSTFSAVTGGTAKVSAYAVGMVNGIGKSYNNSTLTADIVSSIPAVQNQAWTGATLYDGWVIVEYGTGASGGGGGSVSTTVGAIGTYYMTVMTSPDQYEVNRSSLPGTWQAMGAADTRSGVGCGSLGSVQASLWVRTA